MIEKNRRSAEDEDDGGELRAFENSVEDRAAAERIAPELGDVQDDAAGYQEQAGKVTVLDSVRQPEQKPDGDCEEADSGVSLNGVHGDAEGSVAPPFGERVSVDDGPG